MLMTLQLLPIKMMVEILAKVASHLVVDLFNMKCTCKSLYQATKDDEVSQNVTLEQLPIILWPPNKPQQHLAKRVQESHNPHMLLRDGIFHLCRNPMRHFDAVRTLVEVVR